MNDDQKELMRRRVDAAARALNETLADAQRFGLRTRISAAGADERQTVAVTLLRPVELNLAK
jgi:hypothetical protein